MLASNHHSSSIVLLQANVSIEEVVLDKDSISTRLPRILTTNDHSHLVADVNCIASKIGHVIFEFVASDDYIRLHTRHLEIGLFDVNCTTGRSDVL